VRRTASGLLLLPLLLLPLGTAFSAPAASDPPQEKSDKEKKGDAKEGKKDEAKKEPYSAATFAGLKLRAIGPALTSGRIADLAVDPKQPATYYLAVASGGVWKTANAGITFQPVFDGEGSYSTGCVTVDPNDSLVVWVGSGENNSQRSVSYGDGVYKSIDGGQSWENLGLKRSEHIAKILVDPRASDTVYVAAQGPLWSAGGDRGLYKTTDGGKSWKQVLKISDNTGVTDMVFDPRNPDVLYAASYQRRRQVWTLIDGGPESAIYKSRDAGATWRKLTTGLPKEDMGRIGLAISPAAPEVVYATIEAARGASGFYRSADEGANWEKRGSYLSTSPQYYQKIYADPKNADRVYAMDTLMKVSDDGGKSFHNVGEKSKHVDNHVLWIDPANTEHLLAGCDGGLYESFDRGKTWGFKPNLPVAQFYRVDADYDLPFYNVYGGTQDNFSLGGPARTRNGNGIANGDWFVTTGGDGFGSRADPEEPNTVYAQSQYGGIVRFDRRTGEQVDIQPQPAPGEPPLRFNWDAPLLISPHSHTRLYMGAHRLFRSDDRGDSWQAVSPDLTRQIDRNKLKVMGKVWSIDAVAKNASTAFYGNLSALTESPVKEGLIYVGTDDGLVQVSEDGGAHWRKIEHLPGVADDAYVSRLEASRFDPGTVFAAFDNHKVGDFKPYLFKSTDRGATWSSIAGDLPARGTVYALAQDHVERDLLFAGTEFGLFFTRDGGKKWLKLTGGMPTIAVFDICIQRRENDLVLATFGRGFYVLDDYSPLRQLSPKALEQPALLLPVKKVWLYYQSYPLGLPNQSFQGAGYFLAPNPPYGATFTYYLKEDLKSRKKLRQEAEKKLDKEGGVLSYPNWSELRAEEREPEPAIVWTVADQDGHVIRRGTGPASAGLHRVAWDLTFAPANPVRAEPTERDVFGPGPTGPTVVPGTYKVSLAKQVDGALTPLGEAQTFAVEPLGMAGLASPDRAAALAFQQKAANLQRAVLGAARAAEEAEHDLDLITRALQVTPRADAKLIAEAYNQRQRLQDLNEKLTGDRVVAEHNEPTAPSIVERMDRSLQWGGSAAPTKTQEDSYRFAADAFTPVLRDLRQLIEVDLRKLEDQMESAGAPWTPGRVPVWRPE
jgi:photosystem II stability/assembly factor-like uncharacterized protein